jgi:hypothetical protein
VGERDAGERESERKGSGEVGGGNREGGRRERKKKRKTHCDSVRKTGIVFDSVKFLSRNPYLRRIEIPRSTAPCTR